ncbi:MAG: type II toxin-antitoxin system ParD family antitoxin [Chitinophagaceae bacterium]|nr:type II toxin-antitoxin system ParD family antitoxin [Polaromonas sp.]
MRTARPLNIQRPSSRPEPVKAKSLARELAIDTWLLQAVGPAYDAMRADPSWSLSIDQVRDRLAAEHAMLLRV